MQCHDKNEKCKIQKRLRNSRHLKEVSNSHTDVFVCTNSLAVEAMSKAHFLELLKTTPAVATAAQQAVAVEKASDKPIHVASGSGAAWLRDDFMRNAEMKDWDKSNESMYC